METAIGKPIYTYTADRNSRHAHRIAAAFENSFAFNSCLLSSFRNFTAPAKYFIFSYLRQYPSISYRSEQRTEADRGLNHIRRLRMDTRSLPLRYKRIIYIYII